VAAAVPPHFLSNLAIKYCAIVKEKISFGPMV